MSKQLHRLSLTEVLVEITGRRLTSEAYTQALLSRIASLDAGIQAWAWLEPVKAIEAARRSDRYLADGGKPGTLQGLPIGIKDIIATADMPTEMGSPAFAGHVPNRSARVIERLEANGAFGMGKTVTTECAFYHPGKTRNPWNASHTPGGSSSGSAAAVAAGFVPAALGTQTNGSIIRPASYCGVVGYKPTFGLIPTEGVMTFSHTLDHVGVFARSVKDAAWLAAALMDDNQGVSREISTCPAPPRLGAAKTYIWEQAEDHGKRKFIETIALLKERGAHVDEIELPPAFSLAHQTIRTLMAVEAAFNLEAVYLGKTSLLSPILRDLLSEGRGARAIVYLQALKTRLNLRNELNRFLTGYDAIITPPTTGEAPATLEHTGSPAFCSTWTLCGVPVITVPIGLGPGGLPLGLQIVGAEGKDNQVLAVAQWCEKLFPFTPLE